MSFQRLLPIPELLHQNFIDFMYPYFGLVCNPGYQPISIRPLLSSGGVARNTETGALRIVLSDYLFDDENLFRKRELEYTCFHESAHCLHARSFPLSPKKAATLGNVILSEIVADFAAHYFIYLSEGTDSTPFFKDHHSDLGKVGSELFQGVLNSQRNFSEMLLFLACSPIKKVYPWLLAFFNRNFLYSPKDDKELIGKYKFFKNHLKTE